MFRLVLNSSNDVFCPPETGFFRKSLRHRQKNIHRVAARVDSALEIGEEAVTSCVLSSSNSIEAMDKMMWIYRTLNHFKKKAWAEKTPRNCHSYQALAEQSNNVKFVSIIRDGRDVVTSRLGNLKTYHCDVERYVETMRLVFGFNHPAHKILRYEDIVTNPLMTFKELFDWLELPFHESYVTHYSTNIQQKDVDNHQQALLSKPIASTQIERWKKPEYSQRIIEFMENREAVYCLELSGYKV